MIPAVTDTFFPNRRQPEGVVDPVFGRVQHGTMNRMRTVSGTQIGVAQLTDGARVVTRHGDGSISKSRGYFRRRCADRHVDLGGHRYTLHHTSLRRAQLLRDGTPICWLRSARGGRFFQGGTFRSYEVLSWADTKDPAAAAVAHLLASTYDVGAFGVVLNTLVLLTIPFRLLGALS
jgi:hypothetical protein